MTTLDDLLSYIGQVGEPVPDAVAAGRITLDAAVAVAVRDGRRRGPARRGPAALTGGTPPCRPASTAAAAVLRQAGQASAAQGTGWPHAAYWYSTSTYTNGGHTYRREMWTGHHAPSVLRDSGMRPGVLPLGDSTLDAEAALLSRCGYNRARSFSVASRSV